MLILPLSLFSNEEVLEPSVEPVTEIITYTRTKHKSRNGCRNLPDNLPRERIEYDLTEEQKNCSCGGKLHPIGEDILEQLEYIPATMKVLQHIKLKYACRSCEKILTATMPEQPIAKGFVGPNLLAHVIVSKYEDYLPLYRQERIFARHSLELSRSTLCDWILQAADLLAPLREKLEQKILMSPKIHTDDSPILVQVDNGKNIQNEKNIKTGRLWVYIGCGGVDPPTVVYRYSPNRNSEWPFQFLRSYRGYLQADAYSGYDCLYTTNDIIEVGCFAHARRKFVEIAKNTKTLTRAHQALGYIKKLYEIETEAKDLSNEERKNIRQVKARPILDEFKKWLDVQINELPEQTPMYKAAAYSVNAWVALNRYLENGILEITTIALNEP
jgi:transposase